MSAHKQKIVSDMLTTSVPASRWAYPVHVLRRLDATDASVIVVPAGDPTRLRGFSFEWHGKTGIDWPESISESRIVRVVWLDDAGKQWCTTLYRIVYFQDMSVNAVRLDIPDEIRQVLRGMDAYETTCTLLAEQIVTCEYDGLCEIEGDYDLGAELRLPSGCPEFAFENFGPIWLGHMGIEQDSEDSDGDFVPHEVSYTLNGETSSEHGPQVHAFAASDTLEYITVQYDHYNCHLGRCDSTRGNGRPGASTWFYLHVAEYEDTTMIELVTASSADDLWSFVPMLERAKLYEKFLLLNDRRLIAYSKDQRIRYLE